MEGKAAPGAGPFRILVVDDHPVVRHGLAMALGRHADLQVCGEAGDFAQALKAMDAFRPDLVLADLDLEGASGLDLIKAARDSHPGIPILVLSMHDEDLYAERSLRAGARGYIMKNAHPDDVAQGIRAALGGDVVLSDKVKRKILGGLSGAREAGSASGVERLSDRELQVFRMLGEGMTTRQMADKLSLSVKTIEAHLAHLKQKLGTETGKDLQRRAFAWVSEQGARPKS
jgi:DNA-binding NarL/FixJ family response regulator